MITLIIGGSGSQSSKIDLIDLFEKMNWIPEPPHTEDLIDFADYVEEIPVMEPPVPSLRDALKRYAKPQNQVVFARSNIDYFQRRKQ